MNWNAGLWEGYIRYAAGLSLVECLNDRVHFGRPTKAEISEPAFPRGLKPHWFCEAYVRAKARTLQYG